MNAIRAVIVDDEPLARRGIRQLLEPHGDVEIAGEARNGREAVRLLEALRPDLVFLDVQMPELDGFAVLRRWRPERLPAVVFVTAHDAFAVRAFEAHALDYLVKPVHEARFELALTRVRERMRSAEALALSQRLSALLADGFDLESLATDMRPTSRPLAIGATGGGLIFDPSEIEWIEAEDYYAAVHARGKRHLVRESLASMQDRLDPACFVRVHRRAIVNLAQVRGLQPGEDGGVLLRDGTIVPLSRRRREQVSAAIRRYVDLMV
ncbi:response regulator transcription factor [Luteimonas gilva]|uniref:Response regulator transcription factor n=1 Tax=Luteimonas gilva TaxID=2572684 RepID=A0A4U5JQJ2_9GAMM|nr:LytTR family DNA-binding domain-containing protein [Luteimonas gilva]TKR30718.1 response regulator transcription factor [Luteimonas gilva]